MAAERRWVGVGVDSVLLVFVRLGCEVLLKLVREFLGRTTRAGDVSRPGVEGGWPSARWKPVISDFEITRRRGCLTTSFRGVGVPSSVLEGELDRSAIRVEKDKSHIMTMPSMPVLISVFFTLFGSDLSSRSMTSVTPSV